MDSTDAIVDWLYETTMDTPGVGDSITYAAGGVRPRTINAHVSHRDKTEALAGTQLTDQDIVVEVLMRDVPVVSQTDLITLPRIGARFAPREWTRDDAGKSWIIYVRKAR